MKKKKKEIHTLPLDEVFVPSVHVDFDNGAVYDIKSGLAIGFINPKNDIIEITIKPPRLLNEDRKAIPPNLLKYFGKNIYHDLTNQLYLHVCNGYLHIGEMAPSGIYASLALPRIYEQDEDGPEEIPDD